VVKKVEEPCSFQVLKIAVTDDATEILSAYEKVKKDYANWGDSAKPYEREFFRKIMLAGATLKDSNKRTDLVDHHKKALFDVVDETCGALSGTVTSDFYDRMVQLGQNEAFHLAPHLAKQAVDAVLQSRGVKVGDPSPPREPPSPPVLVTALEISAGKDRPHLRWKRPEKGCDRLLVVAKAEGFPGNETDGRVVFEGLGDDCLDDKAVSGKTSYYAVFSRSGNQSSSPAANKSKYFFADGVKGLEHKPGLGQIEIKWETPPANVVVFRWPVGAGGVDRPKGQFPVALPGTKRFDLQRGTSLVETAAHGIVPGAPYEYVIFADYGSVDSNREYSTGQSFTETAVPAAEPAKDLQFRSSETGLELSWKKPGRFCDKVAVIRSTDHPPKDERDGEAVLPCGLTSYVDKSVKPGGSYAYSIFSFYQGYASACVQGTSIYAGPVSGLLAAEPLQTPGRIRLNWTVPKNCEGMRLFRREGSKPEVSVNAATGEPRLVRGDDRTSAGLDSGIFEEAVRPGIEYHYCLYALYTDGQWSGPAFASGRALEAARPASAPACSVTPTGDVKLNWQAPDEDRRPVYRFRILRRTMSTPDGRAPVERAIGETRDLGFVDSAALTGSAGADGPPVPGCCYQYAVQSLVGPVEAGLSAWTNVCVTRDVTMKVVLGADRCVHLEWEPPLNGVRVAVVRKHGGTAATVASDGARAVDRGLTNNVAYTYTVTACFKDRDGKEFCSAGKEVQATPVLPAEPADGLKVAYENGAVRLSWRLPGVRPGGFLISRLVEPPAIGVGDHFDISNISPAERLPGVTAQYDDRAAPVGSVCFYALYSFVGSTATFCGSVPAALTEPVKSLAAGNRGDRVWLQWQWPTGVEGVVVYKKSSDSDSGMRRVAHYTRHQYNAATAFVDPIDRRPALHTYQVRSLCDQRGKPVESLLFAEAATVGGVLPEVTYRVERTRKGVEVTCDLGGVSSVVGGLLLVRNSSREPMDSSDGDTVDKWLPTNSVRPVKSKVDLRDLSKPRCAYYRVFLAEPDRRAQWALVRDPSFEQRKIEFR
jgi:hypothetical protein